MSGLGPNQRATSLPAPVRAFAQGADYIDHKVVAASGINLRDFLAGFLSHSPWWVKATYGARAVFVRLLGRRQEAAPAPLHVAPDTGAVHAER